MYKEFKEGGRYLVGNNGYYNEALLELKVLEISEKAIKIKYGNGNSQWYLKDKFPYKFVEELSIVKQTIEDRSHEIQFEDDAMGYEPDEPQFTLKITEENDIEVKLKSEEKPKLEWQPIPFENSMSWEEALKYVKTLGDGWRLPTRAELIDAYDNKVQGFHSNNYWSSSTYAQNTNYAWLVHFYYGYVYYSNKTYNTYVRCVREVK